MICSVVRKETISAIQAGELSVSFNASQHWQKRITPMHRAIMLLSGGRCLIHSIDRIEQSGTEFIVHLGAGWKAPRQEGLFDE